MTEPVTRDRTYNYRIDEQGAWTCEANPINDPDLCRILPRSLFKDDDGCFWVRCEGEVHPVRVEDAPLVVKAVDLEIDETGLARVELNLADGRRVPLTDSLRVGRGGALYARVGKQGLWARFERPPFVELTRFLEEDQGRYFLTIGGRRFVIDKPEERP